VDGTARVQTVSAASNPRFARLLDCFRMRTGCPVLLNTSFNMNDEPIVMSPFDALICFARSKLDALVLGDYWLRRRDLEGFGLSDCRAILSERPAPIAAARPAAPDDGSRVYTFW
jgi:carbamoyltransferase